MIGHNNMTMMHYNNYEGEYGYDLISIRLYHPFFQGSMLLDHYYRNYIDVDYDDENIDVLMYVLMIMVMKEKISMSMFMFHVIVLLDLDLS